jgi:mono/diheme cytochrome c family protein
MAEMNCVACHAVPEATKVRLASRTSLRLGPDGVKSGAAWLREFLADPQGTKPGTLMPDMLRGLPPERKAEAVEALTHFLQSIAGGAAETGLAPEESRIAEGKALYHEVGCVQCHAPFFAPAGMEAEFEKLAATSVPLAGPGIAKKYTVGELAKLLVNPLKSRPAGRMPSQNLSPREAESIAMYLLRAPSEKAAPAFVVNKETAGLGAQYFVMLQCGNCHTDTPNPYTVSNVTPVAPKLANLRARQPSGCLSAVPKGNAAKFELTDRQRTVILAALKSQEVMDLPLTEDQQIRRTMTALNCYACHSRERRGGVDAVHRAYLDSATDGPPSLNGAGEKLGAGKIREVLTTGKKTRTGLKLRMPVFGDSVSKLPELFEKADRKTDGQ